MDFSNLLHVPHDDLTNEMKEKMASKLGNKTQVYGKKGDKVTLLSKLVAKKDGILEFRTRHQELAVDTTSLLNINQPQLQRMNKNDLSLYYLHVGEMLCSFCEVKRLSLPEESPLRINIETIADHYSQALNEVEHELDGDLKNCLLLQTPQELNRRYLQGGGYLPSDKAYHECQFCHHGRIDMPPTSKTVHEENRAAHTKWQSRLATFNSTGSNITSKGTVSERAPTRPTLKELEYDCHCHHNSCINIATGEGCSKCEARGKGIVDPFSGMSKCELCLCECKVSYPERAILLIGINKKKKTPATTTATTIPSSAPSRAFAEILANSVQDAFNGAQAAFAGRGNISHPSDAEVLEETFFSSLSHNTAVEETINHDGFRDLLGRPGRHMLTGGHLIDSKSTGEKGGERKNNNRLLNDSDSDFSSGGKKKKTNSSKHIHARAASVFGANRPPGVAAAAAAEARLFNSVTPTRQQQRNSATATPHNLPKNLLSTMGCYYQAEQQWNHVQSAAGNEMEIRVPSTKMKNHIEDLRSRSPKRQLEEEWEQLPEQPDSVPAAAAATTSTTALTPVGALVQDLKTKVIHAAQPIVNLDTDTVDAPDSGAQANAMYLYNGTLHDGLLRDVSHAVLQNDRHATGTDVVVAVGNMGLGFPHPMRSRHVVVSSNNKKKKWGLKGDQGPKHK